MEIAHQSIDIDINSKIPQQVQCVAHTNDNNTRFVDVSLYNSGQRITFASGCTFKAIFVTNGILINDNVSCTATNNIIKVPIDKYTLKNIIGGLMAVEIVIKQDEQVISPAAVFYVRVTDSILKNAVLPQQGAGGTIAELLKEIEEVRNEYIKLNEKINGKIDNTDGSVKTNHIANGAVTGGYQGKIAQNTIDGYNIKAGSITEDLIEDGAVGTSKITDKAITAEKIADNAIQTQHIQRGSITDTKLWGIDESPQANSHNVVYSNGIYHAVENAKTDLQENFAEQLSDKENVSNKLTNIQQSIHDPTVAYPSIAFLQGGYYNNKTTDELLGDKENVSNKLTNIQQPIGDPTVSYPSIAFLHGGYYNNKKIDELLESKADFEAGTGSLYITAQSQYFSNAIFNYARINNYVIIILKIDIAKTDDSIRYATFAGLPFMAYEGTKISKHTKTNASDDIILGMSDGTTMGMAYFLLHAPNGISADTYLTETLIYQIKE